MGARWCHSLGEEFSAQKLHLTPSKPELLLQPQWNIPPCLWLFYRFFILLYTLSWCVYTGLLFNTPRWLICLANVSYCLMGLYYLVALINLVAAFAVVRRHCQTQKINYPGSLAVLPLPGCLGRSLSLQWFLHIAQGSLSLTVSALYWSVSFPASRHPLTAFSLNLHVVNTLQTLLDVTLSSMPIHLGHCVYVLITGCLYILFVVPYWLAYASDIRGEVYIYMVDFGERPATHVLITLALCVVCLPFFHFVLWNIGVIREAMAEDDGINPARWWWQKVGGIVYSPGAHFDRDGSVFRISPSKEETAIIEQQTTYY